MFWWSLFDFERMRGDANLSKEDRTIQKNNEKFLFGNLKGFTWNGDGDDGANGWIDGFYCSIMRNVHTNKTSCY